jgi:NADH:ubiquinone oxidoreductase subunit 3 (subunit A)
MLDILTEFLDLVINLFVDETLDVAIGSKNRKKHRFIIFSIMFVIFDTVVLLLALLLFQKYGIVYIPLLLFCVALAVFIFWCVVAYKRKK